MSATRVLWAVLGMALLGSCVQVREVELTFGEEGEGLDGFMCRDNTVLYSQALIRRASCRRRLASNNIRCWLRRPAT